MNQQNKMKLMISESIFEPKPPSQLSSTPTNRLNTIFYIVSNMFWKKRRERKRELERQLKILEEYKEIARNLEMSTEKIRRKFDEAKTEKEEDFWFHMMWYRALEDFENSPDWMEAFRLMG